MNKKEFYKEKLELNDEVENGFLKGFFPSTITIPKSYLLTKGDRYLYSFAYYLLSFPKIGPFHSIAGDASWQLCDGCPFIVHQISPCGKYSSYKIGKDLHKGEIFLHIVPSFYWQAIEVIGSDLYKDFSLISHFVMPAFSYDDRVLGTPDVMKHLIYPKQSYLQKFLWREGVKEIFS